MEQTEEIGQKEFDFTPEQISEYKEAFGVFDRQRKGEVDASEFGAVLRDLGMNLSRREIQEFIDEFNNKLKNSFELFKLRKNKKEKSLRKYFSHNNIEKKIKDKFQSFSTKSERNKDILNNSQLIFILILNIFLNINKSYIWRPPKGSLDYFEKFKYLSHKHELNNWERVSIYNFLIYNLVQNNAIQKKL